MRRNERGRERKDTGKKQSRRKKPANRQEMFKGAGINGIVNRSMQYTNRKIIK